jgi:hypothetical protein
MFPLHWNSPFLFAHLRQLMAVSDHQHQVLAPDRHHSVAVAVASRQGLAAVEAAIRRSRSLEEVVGLDRAYLERHKDRDCCGYRKD